jgi:RNA-binding protein
VNPATLTGKARRHLRGLGHHLHPLVQVGKEGISPSLIAALGTAISDHELVKVKLGENAEGRRETLAEELAAAGKAHLVGLIGRTLLLYRARADKPKIVLPRAVGAGDGAARVPSTARAPKTRKRR